MTVIYKGLNCLTDVNNPLYAVYKTESRTGKLTFQYQQHYANFMLYFGSVMVFLLMLKNIYYKYNDWTYRNYRLENKDASKIWFNFRILNRLIGASRFISYKKISLIISRITGLPPSLGTIIVILVSSLYILCFLFIPHFWYRACKGFGTAPLAVRAALMVMGITPFSMILSGKTNFISHVTGISYEKVNIFHQFLGWMTLFLTLVHMIPFYVQDLREGGYKEVVLNWKTNILYKNGYPSFVILTVMCFMSLRIVRNQCYEFFLNTHWILGVTYLGLLIWHVGDQDNSNKYIFASFGFWGFQVLYRIFVKTTFKPNLFAFRSKSASLRVLPNDAFQVCVLIRDSYELKWSPGQHIYIRFVHGLRTIDNHPFSILTASSGDTPTELKLIVKPHRGLTRKLYTELVSDSKQAKEYKIFIDGCYGGINRDPLSFDKVLLVSSNTGITATFSFLQYYVANLDNASSALQEIELVWIISDLNSINWVKHELNELFDKIELMDDLKLMSRFKIHIFATNSELNRPVTVPTVSEVNKTEIKQFNPNISIYSNQKPELSTFVPSLGFSTGKNMIICSGSKSVQNDVGNAASVLQRQAVNNTIQEIYLHTENFGV